MCFELQYEEEDEYLRKASQYIKQPDTVDEISLDALLHEENSELRKRLENFNQIAKINVNNKNVTFIIAASAKVVDKINASQTAGNLMLYSCNHGFKSIDMPCKPK